MPSGRPRAQTGGSIMATDRSGLGQLVEQQEKIVEAVGKAYLDQLNAGGHNYVKDYAVANGLAIDKLMSLYRVGRVDTAGNPAW